MTAAPNTIEREVWATPTEFRRGLSLAFPARVVERNGLLCVNDGQAAMEIALEVMPPQTIALLELPRMKVSLRGTLGTPDMFRALVARMDLAMQRGGG
jgi:hypothetical protein